MKSIFLIVISTIIVNFSSMSQNEYIIKPTSECIKLLESDGRKIDTLDFFETLPGGAGLIFLMSNDKVVLIPSNFDTGYPGFIYETKKELEEMIKRDFFPIPEKYMSVWELERERLAKLPVVIDYYKEFLFSELRFRTPLNKLDNFRKLYEQIAASLKEKKPLIKKEKLMISFALLFMNYLSRLQNNTWFFETRYEMYNSYKYPLLILHGNTKDIIQQVFISLNDVSSDFDFFIKFIEE